jgi:hypothetical protein
MDVEVFKAELGKRIAGCFLCLWIHQDYAENGHLTLHPGKCITGESLFPPESKQRHLDLEGLLAKGEKPPVLEIQIREEGENA